MQTKLIEEKDLNEAALFLQREELVAFPTETVYGLGASIFSEKAIYSLFQVKGRPQDNPLIAHLHDVEQVFSLAKDIPPAFDLLVEAFSPGPLTFVLPKKEGVSALASGGLDTIALRIPKHRIARELIRQAGVPLVAPSANLSGKPSSTTVSHVLEDFNGKISAVVVGEPSEIGIESTVVSLLHGKVQILRPGAISQEEMEACLKQQIPCHSLSQEEISFCPSPGMKYRHYAPSARVLLFFSPQEALSYLQQNPRQRMVLAREELFLETASFSFLSSASFYASLRLADQKGCQEVIVICDEVIQANKGLMNRIEKASGS